MKTKPTRLDLSLAATIILSLALPVPNASAQQWTTNNLPSGLTP